jgi:CTP synthase
MSQLSETSKRFVAKQFSLYYSTFMVNRETRFIFVCGGVLSGVGKGIVTASLGYLLKSKGFSVTAVKIDPYLNIDAGLMRPAEHGEVFVTDDGGEFDQDLGNYERYLGTDMHKTNNITSGKIYQNIIKNERAMAYGGRDVEMFPDVIDQVKDMIWENVNGEDFVLVEIGGTTGDVENLPFLHAAREMGRENKSIYIMVTYLPYLRSVGELKTKPTQHAVARLREVGIMPDFIVTRNEIPLDEPRRESISKRCFIPQDHIIDNPDIDSIYDIPPMFEREGFGDKVLDCFGMRSKPSDLKQWEKLVSSLTKSKKEIKIGIVGKYVKSGSTEHKDTYISVLEAIKHAAGNLGYKPIITMISSEDFEKGSKKLSVLDEFDGVIVPQGWGGRGSEGKIHAIEYIREHKIPYLGLCYGMQMACIEFARNVLKLKDANSEEIDPKTKNPIIHIMPDQKEYLAQMQYGGTIRLGAWECTVKPKTLVHDAYTKHDQFEDAKRNLVCERHRHRYEFNNEYRAQFEEAGMVISGTSPDDKLVEFVELPKDVHPFFVGTQAHPEYKSQPMRPHPLFTEFMKAANKHKMSK